MFTFPLTVCGWLPLSAADATLHEPIINGGNLFASY